MLTTFVPGEVPQESGIASVSLVSGNPLTNVIRRSAAIAQKMALTG